MSRVEKLEGVKENREGWVHASGWASLAGGLGGDRIDPVDLLPNPAIAKEQQRQVDGLSQQTKQILERLVRSNRLHPAIAAKAWIAAKLEE